MDAEQGQRPGLVDRFPRLFQVQRKGKDKGQLENFRGLEAQSQKRDFEPCPVVDVGIPLLANKIGEEHQPSGNGQIDLPKPGQLAVVEAREKAGPEKAERGCKNLHQKNPQLDIAREINPPEQEGRKGEHARPEKQQPAVGALIELYAAAPDVIHVNSSRQDTPCVSIIGESFGKDKRRAVGKIRERM